MPRREERIHFAILLKIYFVSTCADIQKVFKCCYITYCNSFKSCLANWTVVNHFQVNVFHINRVRSYSLVFFRLVSGNTEGMYHNFELAGNSSHRLSWLHVLWITAFISFRMVAVLTFISGWLNKFAHQWHMRLIFRI
jgi:hypothetical protein